MRILHIGDYHFKAKSNSYEQSLMVEKMIANLKGKEQIDFLFFTGDLVFSGKTPEDFEKAHSSLIDKLVSSLNLDKNNIIICAGNHDTNREDSSKAVINYFDKEVTDNEQLNQLFTQKDNDFTTSLKPISNFFTYIKNHFDNPADTLNELFSTHTRTIGGTKIGIVSLNSAWLSSGFRWDNGNLMLPTTILKEAINKIKHSSCKIILLHHPLSYFKEFNAIELEDLMHKEFNLLFSGHIHREQISTKYAGDNGIYTNTTQATLTFDKAGEIGYSLISYDLEEEGEITLERATYSPKEHLFTDLSPVIIHVPCGQEKANQNKLRKKITSKFRVELNNSNELLLDYDEASSKNFLELFTNPVLSKRSDAEATKNSDVNSINYESLYLDNVNYLLFGKDKCGKTSILKKIQLHFLKNYSFIGKVPLYLDYKQLENKTTKIDIKKILRNYYEVQTTEASNIITQGKLVLLIDNLNTSSNVNEFIISFLEENPNVRFIMCSDYLTSRIYFEDLDHLSYEKLFFKDLSRKEIRLYTEKHPSVKVTEQEVVLERITKLCQDIQLPLNYWTISLILLIYKKSNDDYNKNLFAILDLCVDEILQKKQLLLNKSKLTFEQYKEVCSKLAHHLLVNHKNDTYSATDVSLITYLSDLIKSNPRLVGDPKEIFDYLLSSGILKEKLGKYTFRLNGLFEYFLAFYINHHPEFKKEILGDDSIFLTFKNELEIYSGFNRQDIDFLKQVFLKTKKVFDTIINSYKETGSLDAVLMKKLGEANEFSSSIKKLKVSKPLAHEMQDALRDENNPLNTESDVHLKELIDANSITLEVLEKYLNILSRIFKNSDNISDIGVIYEIFDYLIEAYCNFGFYIIDDVSKSIKEQNRSAIESGEKTELIIGDELLKMITNFIPLLTQVLLYDGVGHINLKNIITNKIEEYKKDIKNNQYRLFLLYYLLADIDVKGSKKTIDEAIQNISLGPLKVSTYFKMNFYLAFKAYNNPQLESYFKAKIQQTQHSLEKKTDIDDMNRYLSKKQKRNLVRKQKER